MKYYLYCTPKDFLFHLETIWYLKEIYRVSKQLSPFGIHENKNGQQQHALRSSSSATDAKKNSRLHKSSLKTPIMISNSNKSNKKIINDTIGRGKLNNKISRDNDKKKKPSISKENLDELCAGVDFNFDDAFADGNFL